MTLIYRDNNNLHFNDLNLLLDTGGITLANGGLAVSNGQLSVGAGTLEGKATGLGVVSGNDFTIPTDNVLNLGADSSADWSLWNDSVGLCLRITHAGINHAISVDNTSYNATFLGSLFTHNGGNSAPAYSFASAPTTGMFLNDPNEISFTAGGVQVMDVGTSEGGLIMEGGFGIYMGTSSIFQADDGSLSALAIQFASAPDSGFYNKTADTTQAGMAFVSGGAIRTVFGGNSLNFYDGFYLSFHTDFDGGIYFGPTEASSINGNDSRLEFAAGGTLAFTLPSTGGIAEIAAGLDFGISGGNNLTLGYDQASSFSMYYDATQGTSGELLGFLDGNDGSPVFILDHATGDLSLQSHKLHDVANPSSAQDAATKSYVDSAAGAVASAALTGQTGSVSTVTSYTPGTAGIYRVSVYQVVTLADTGGATTANATITWKDDSGVAQSFTTSNLNVLVLGAYNNTTFLVQSAASQLIKVAAHISSTFATPQYAVYAAIEKIA